MGQKIETLKTLVTNAERNGSLRADLAAAFWNVVGGRQGTDPVAVAAPVDREVTVRVRVSGTADAAGYTREINAEVERALTPLANQVGLRVTPGSVNVTGV